MMAIWIHCAIFAFAVARHVRSCRLEHVVSDGEIQNSESNLCGSERSLWSQMAKKELKLLAETKAMDIAACNFSFAVLSVKSLVLFA